MKQSHRPTAEAFERLCAPYSGMVYRHCLHMLGNPHEAEDAAQESMLRAFRAFDAFRGDAVASWLFRIAHLSGHLGKRARAPRKPDAGRPGARGPRRSVSHAG